MSETQQQIAGLIREYRKILTELEAALPTLKRQYAIAMNTTRQTEIQGFLNDLGMLQLTEKRGTE